MLYIRYGALLIKTAIHTIIKVMEHSQETQEKHKGHHRVSSPIESILLHHSLLLNLILIHILRLYSPIPPRLAPDPTNPLPPVRLLDRPRVPLVHHAREHHRRHEHPHVPALHCPPPPPLDTHLPQAVDAGARRVQHRAPASLAYDPRPEARQEPAQEDALRRQEAPREPRLEEADARPGRGDGARDEGGREQRAGDQAVQRRHGEVVEAAEARDHERRVDEDEELGERREGAQPEG